jgi:hypothetical protein
VDEANTSSTPGKTKPASISKSTLVRIFAIIYFTTAIGGLIFQSTTFARLFGILAFAAAAIFITTLLLSRSNESFRHQA